MRYGGLIACFMMAALGIWVTNWVPEYATRALPAIIGIGIAGIAFILVDIAENLRNRR